MTAEAWIALGGAVVALIVADVTWRQFQLQRSSAQGDTQAQFNEIIHKLAALVSQSPPPSGNVNPPIAETQALISQAQGLLHGDSEPRRGRLRERIRRNRSSQRPSGGPHAEQRPSGGPHADSVSCIILAMAFAMVWDMKRAEKYWDRAVTRAKDPQSLVYALRGRALFLYSRSRDDEDLRRGKRDFGKALEVLKSRTHGNDLVRSEDATTLIMRAQCELGLGNEADTTWCLEEAWRKINGILSLWRRNGMIYSIAYFAVQTNNPKLYSKIPELDQKVKELFPFPSYQLPFTNTQAGGSADTQHVGSRWPPPPPPPPFDRASAGTATDNSGA
jgi:hypothetical protein